MSDSTKIKDIEAIKLSDGKLSVRLYGDEVCIIPKKEHCTSYILEKCLNQILESVLEYEDRHEKNIEHLEELEAKVVQYEESIDW